MWADLTCKACRASGQGGRSGRRAGQQRRITRDIIPKMTKAGRLRHQHQPDSVSNRPQAGHDSMVERKRGRDQRVPGQRPAGARPTNTPRRVIRTSQFKALALEVARSHRQHHLAGLHRHQDGGWRDLRRRSPTSKIPPQIPVSRLGKLKRSLAPGLTCVLPTRRPS